MGKGEDHVVLAENVKAQQFDQVLALFERGIEHDHARSLVRKAKNEAQEIYHHCGKLRGFGVFIVHHVHRSSGNASPAVLAAGYQPLLFSSAEAFLGTATAHLAACMVLDIHLPGMSGLELGRKLTASGRVPPIIFITGQDDDAAREEARQLQCLAYFRKPFEGVALLDAIRQALSAHKGAN